MGAHQQIRLMAHGFAHQAHQAHGAFQRFLGRLPRIVGRVAAGGIELAARKTLLDILRRAFGRCVRIVVELIALAVGRVEIGVAAQALVHLAAQEVVDRLFEGLADDVPTRHLQTADHAHERQVHTRPGSAY